jgi:alanyl-tRNA synthetase
VEFGDSVELCGGTHVESTGRIGIVKIVAEGAIAAGVRRIEAVTASRAEEYINERLDTVDEIAGLLKSTGSITDSVSRLIAENASLKKGIEKLQIQSLTTILEELQQKAVVVNMINVVSGIVETDSPELLKNSAYKIRNSSQNTVFVFGSEASGKANLLVLVSDDLVKDKDINAIVLIKEISPEINGGGGGQPFLASAGGKNPAGLEKAIARAKEYIRHAK